MNLLLSIAFIIIPIYLICGLLFAIAFLIKGIAVVDESAHGSGIGFRMIILPGVIVFWPLLLKKWIRAKKEIV